MTGELAFELRLSLILKVEGPENAAVVYALTLCLPGSDRRASF